MKRRKASIVWIGLVMLLAGAILTACAGGANGPTSTPTTAGVPYPAYPAYPAPPTGVSPTYPGPEETMMPDSPATSPAYPSADQPSNQPQPYAPQPGDAALQRGEAFLEPDQQDILTLESFPPQFNLALKGSLPTPCHELRVTVAPPNDQNEIIVTPYSVVDPAKICTQVLEPFDATIPLRGMPAGTYTVVVNTEPVGEINVP